jgi:hypothetical protein
LGIPIEHMLERAGRWFLESGIQEANGGVARYHRLGEGNLPVSCEITGYAASFLAWLHGRTGEGRYRDAAVRCARFLLREGWDPAAHTFAFEPGADRAYFFDLGIIARGLLAVWRLTGEEQFRARARDAALSLGFDFLGEGVFHPVISLPMKEPLPQEPRWSRQPGCFQLKSALIWCDMDDEHAKRMFEVALAMALASHEAFLAREPERERVMDRLHAYCYFLEALVAAGEHAEARAALAAGIERVGRLLREIAPAFERSDVHAQLLRVRLMAHHAGLAPLEACLAAEEAARVAAFQVLEGDRHAVGGFCFGRRAGAPLPFANPVSTAFCAQALALWDDHQKGRWSFELTQLV